MNERTDGQIENIMLPTDSLAWRRQTKSRITRHSCQKGKEKGKGKCIYIALIFFVVRAKRSGMDHTVLPAITPMPAFTS